MYCTKCGKQIDYDADVCNECSVAENAQQEVKDESAYSPFEEAVAPAPADADNRMFGFGKALASTIIATFNVIFSVITIILSVEIPEAGIVLFLMGVAMCALSLIFGIQSICTFKKRCKENCAKPIPALVLGIVGIATSALASIYLFMALFCAMFFI